MREESAHTKFYLSVAKIELQRNNFARKIAHFIINKFYTPVGQGSRPKSQTDYLISTLFGGEDGSEWIDRTVTQKIQRLPGFTGLTKITDTITNVQTGQFA